MIEPSNLSRLRELITGIETSERQLVDRTRLLHSIYANTLDAIIVMDDKGSISEWNPSAVKIFGYTRDEAVGSELCELIIPEELRDAHRKGLKKYLATGESLILSERINLEGIRRDGERFPLELTIVEVEGSDPVNFAGFVRDLTERPINE